MANSWGTNPIILDTANDDESYIAANDAKNGGTKYSTMRYKIKKVLIRDGSEAAIIKLTKCARDNLAGTVIFETTEEYNPITSGHLELDFGDGVWIDGLNPETLDDQGANSLLEIQVWLA